MQTLLVLILIAAAIYVAWMFNRLVRDRNQVHAAWSDVDVQLQRRHDLVPNLVEIVRGYAGHEKDLLTRVTAERSAAQAASGVAARGNAESRLGVDLTRLLAIAEAYPDLKANSNFAQLSTELVEVEDAIQYARRFYNGSVRDFNTHIERFPDSLIAHAFHFEPAEFFSADPGVEAVPQVSLD